MFRRGCLSQCVLASCRDVGTNRLLLLQASSSPPSTRLTSSGPPPAAPPKPGSFSDRYDKFIGKWPKVHALHRMVVDGSRWCFSDIKTYIRVRRDLASKKRTVTDLNMAELEVLIQSGGELAKMLALVVVLQIPGPGDILILLLIFFPRLVLTRHFWSDAQRKKFFQIDVTRSMTNTALLTELVGNPASVREIHLPPVKNFKYDLLLALSAIHSIYPLPGIRRRFQLRCDAMRQLDKLVAKNINSLSSRQLHFHLYIRRITDTCSTDAEMRRILESWLKFTRNLDDGAYLCAPVFFNKRT